MSQRDDNYEWLKIAIADSLGIEEERITPAMNLVREGMDSLDLTELDMLIEEAFGVEIPDDTAYPETVSGWMEIIGGTSPLVKQTVKRKRLVPEMEKADSLI